MKRTLIAAVAAIAASLLGSGCSRRAYPAVSIVPDSRRAAHVELQLGAVAMLGWDKLVAIDESDAGQVFEIPFVGSAGPQTVADADPVDLFPWIDPSEQCPPDARRCRAVNYRAQVPAQAVPITWLPRETGEEVMPHHVEDLAAVPCEGSCVMGLTEFTTTGRLTRFREDQVARGRDETERLFVLRRDAGAWIEERWPDVERLREQISDWGRASCVDDLVVEGLAVDPDAMHVYIGIRRCDGAAQRVLQYDLGAAMRGNAVTLRVVADGVVDASGRDVAGVSEGLSSLDWAHGRLWATTSWDDFGHQREAVYGARLLVADGGALRPVPLPAEIRDRADALVILPVPGVAPADAPLAEVFPDVHALLFFDNDRRADLRNGTLIHALLPRPEGGAYAELSSLQPGGVDAPLGLNGFDFRWYLRDHRLGQLSVVGGEQPSGPGAWTTELGGLWQVRLGALGQATRPVLGKAVGHNRQAVALTDYSPAQELTFTPYRAVVSVVPRERFGNEVSIDAAMAAHRSDYEVSFELPDVEPGDGLVLQGVTLDSASRASGGICLSAVDLGVRWADPEQPGPAVARAMLLGGLCNDFNTQESGEHHGLTTNPAAGVRAVLYFAVVHGGQARSGSIQAAQRDRPGKRSGPTSLHLATDDAPTTSSLAAYRRASSPERIGNHSSKANLACFQVDEGGLAALNDTSMSEWRVDVRGSVPQGEGVNRAGSLSGFAFALDLRGFGRDREAYSDISALQARSQNVYLYRYLMRSWLEPGVLLEGGMSHGLHLSGLGKDNASATAALVRADLTWWDGLSADPIDRDLTDARPRRDPNAMPEDGFLRWARTVEREAEAACISSH